MQQSIMTFGQQQVTLDGRIMLWTAPAAQRLFYFLLAHPDGSTRNTLIQKMDVAENSLRVIQHRLRQALGQQDAIVERGDRYSLAPIYYKDVDFLLFKDALNHAKRAEDREHRLRWLSQAMSLYAGDFLPNYTDDWVEEIRTTLRAAYVQARLETASLHCVAVECQSAVRNLATGLASDPLIGEQFHRNLMTCLCSLNRPDDAMSHYRRFLGFIQSNVGDAPTHTTIELADQIRNGHPHPAPSIGSPLPCQRRLLYGTRSLGESAHHLDLDYLAKEAQRGKQMVTLLQKMINARNWTSLSHCVQQFLDTHIGTTYIYLVPDRPSLSHPQEFTLDHDITGWPASVISDFKAITEAVQSGRGSEEPVANLLRTTTYLLGNLNQPPLARLYVARSEEEQILSASDAELLARVANALTSIISQKRWLTQ